MQSSQPQEVGKPSSATKDLVPTTSLCATHSGCHRSLSRAPPDLTPQRPQCSQRPAKRRLVGTNKKAKAWEEKKGREISTAPGKILRGFLDALWYNLVIHLLARESIDTILILGNGFDITIRQGKYELY